jgi:hypothetical protein
MERRAALLRTERSRESGYDFTGDELVPSGAPTVVVSGLPVGGDHSAENRRARRKGQHVREPRLRIELVPGCQPSARIPGIDPCPELEVRAGIWRFSATAADRRSRAATAWPLKRAT